MLVYVAIGAALAWFEDREAESTLLGSSPSSLDVVVVRDSVMLSFAEVIGPGRSVDHEEYDPPHPDVVSGSMNGFESVSMRGTDELFTLATSVGVISADCSHTDHAVVPGLSVAGRVDQLEIVLPGVVQEREVVTVDVRVSDPRILAVDICVSHSSQALSLPTALPPVSTTTGDVSVRAAV